MASRKRKASANITHNRNTITVDFDNTKGIIIRKDENGSRKEITISNEFKFYKYNPNAHGYIEDEKDFNEIRKFQTIIRILDMIKDGSATAIHIPNADKEIKTLMDWNTRVGTSIAYAHLDEIVKAIQDKNKSRITMRTWLKANQAAMNQSKLPYTYYYRESGIDPLVIIDQNAYPVSNSITEFIDPLKRGQYDKTPLYFPDKNRTL